MSMKRPRTHVQCLLCTAILVSLVGCTAETPPSQNAPPEARAPADTATRNAAAQKTASDGGAEPMVCTETGTVGLPAGVIGGHNALHRTGEPQVMPIFSLKADSRAWQTDCPVPLTLPVPEPSVDCHADTVLPRPAVLTLTHIADTETYDLTIAPPIGQPGIIIQRVLQPVLSPVEPRQNVTWLTGAADAALNADLYVYLRDTTGESGGRPHKNYVVEVFAKGEQHCDAHRPHLSTCKSDDFPDRAECTPGLGQRQGVQVGIKQTDTGTGNEPPAV